MEMHGRGNFNFNLQETLNNLMERTQVNSDLIKNKAMESTDIWTAIFTEAIMFVERRKVMANFFPLSKKSFTEANGQVMSLKQILKSSWNHRT